jgi:hypothetical protein
MTCAVPLGRLPGRDEEREHADDRGAELAGRGRDAAHPVLFGTDRRADRDLPDG